MTNKFMEVNILATEGAELKQLLRRLDELDWKMISAFEKGINIKEISSAREEVKNQIVTTVRVALNGQL